MKLGTSIKRFPWKGCVNMAKYDCKRTIELVKNFTITYPAAPNKTWQTIEAIRKVYKLDCWLINPVEFFLSNSTDNEKCVYLDLASKRNWADYEFKKQTSLPLYVAEDYYNIKLLESNILLEINDKSIDFKY